MLFEVHTNVRQHVPGFVSGVEPAVADARSLAELVALPFVRDWEVQPEFGSWAVGEGRYLMAIMTDGKYWVAAYLDEPELYGLPVWTKK